MKKFLSVLLCTLLFLSFWGCGNAPNEETKMPSDPPLGEDGIATILLDPGHGFGDVGCISEFLGDTYEHHLTMDFTNRLKKMLEGIGYNVLLTHDGGNLPNMKETIAEAENLRIEFDSQKITPENNIFDAYERTVYANVLAQKTEIDLFFSIHVNANADTNTAQGFEIDYCAENSSSEMSSFAFDAVCERLEEAYPHRRLKKFADSWDMSFVVNKYTSMPSILFETAYASTPSEATLLLDESWREALMHTIANGIKDYFALEYKK